MFKVCDEPHPLLIKEMLGHCSKSDLDPAYKIAKKLWNLGYSAEDIITNVFRVCKTHNELAEYIKLEFIKVKQLNLKSNDPDDIKYCRIHRLK